MEELTKSNTIAASDPLCTTVTHSVTEERSSICGSVVICPPARELTYSHCSASAPDRFDDETSSEFDTVRRGRSPFGSARFRSAPLGRRSASRRLLPAGPISVAVATMTSTHRPPPSILIGRRAPSPAAACQTPARADISSCGRIQPKRRRPSR